MKLYFSPLACSVATRIALYEAGAAATYVEVDPATKKTLTGDDFLAVNPLGLVPTLEIDGGEVLTENAAILQYVADRFPASGLAPADHRQRTRLHQWLCFVGTELHKGLFAPLLDPAAAPEVKAYALAKGISRMQWLAQELGEREFLLDAPGGPSVADAYLFAVLNWCAVTPVELERWPNLRAYHQRLYRRAAFQRAVAEERELYLAELARHGAGKEAVDAVAQAIV